MKIATWNVNGIRAREAQALAWIERDRPDVICLQEIKASLDQVPAALRDLPGYRCTWHGNKGYSGVALLLRADLPGVAVGGSGVALPVEARVHHPPFDVETRIVAADLGPRLTVVSVYVPNGGKDFPAKMAFFEALDAWVAEAHAAGRALVVCGDLNIARTDQDLHPKERKAGIIGQRSDERALFERLLGRGLVDVGRALAPDDDGLFTWWAPWRNMRQRNIGWRIDYILASASLARRATACTVAADIGTSDHAPVIATFADAFADA